VIATALDALGSEPVRAFETLFEVDRRARELAREEIAGRTDRAPAR